MQKGGGGSDRRRDSLRQGNLRRLPEEMEFEAGLEMLPHRGVEKGGKRFHGVFWKRGFEMRARGMAKTTRKIARR